MRKAAFMVCAAFSACVIAMGIAGCSASDTTESVVVSGSDVVEAAGGESSDNSILTITSLNSGEDQDFTVVTFGTYEQDGDESNGAEDIEWYVLDEQDGKTLLISKYVLDAVPYYSDEARALWGTSSPRANVDIVWSDSTVRTWLNEIFYEAAFSVEEQSVIETTTISDSKMNGTYMVDEYVSGENTYTTDETEDNVFLLSVSEARSYFVSQLARMALPTEYAIANGVYTGISDDGDEDKDGYAVWWLRTTGYYSGYSAVVNDDGYVNGDGYNQTGELHDGYEDHGTVASELGGNIGVRPCVWVDSSAIG